MNDGSLVMKVRAALRGVSAPAGGDLVTAGAIEGLSADADGAVRFALNMDRAGGGEGLLGAARAAVLAISGVTKVTAVATAHRTAPASPPAAAGAHDNPLQLGKRARIAAAADQLAGVRNVIAIASGKGGVGKSTIAANLAVAFARRGLSTGLLDADIYGPSLPTLFALTGKPAMRDGKIVPVEKYGVRSMSIGLLVDANKALAWRGPMVMGAVRQLMSDVDWGALDVLVIDTPPGTGDAHLTLAQAKVLTGVVIVSTPQEMALADVRRGVELFRSVSVPIIGIVENMAWFEAPSGERLYLFGRGGAERAASDLGAPFLGALPIDEDLRIASDEGEPLVIRAPGSASVAALDRLAAQIAATFN
ncbi:MAG: Mrp/NBP35 family ATP-binding protein [Parvularculaceae bacterium]